MPSHPVVLYGASGYTGRLIAEYLRDYSVPFVALGRDEARVGDVMGHVPGITDVEHEVGAVEHTVDALSERFDGAKVVCNTVGPFATYGHEVVQACLNVGAHYLDTTGEQNWMIDAEAQYGEAFAEKGIVLLPCLAQMYTTGEIAANVALETPGLDTLDILVLWKGFPTTASTASIFTILMAKHYYLEDNAYQQWDPRTHFDLGIPGQHEPAIVLPWGGTGHPVWFKDDHRVSSCRVLGGVQQRELMEGVIQIVDAVEEQVKPLASEEEQKAAMSQIAESVGASEMPPRENHRLNRSIESVHASGPLGTVSVTLQGACNYKQTGLLQAFGAHRLVHGGGSARVGFASGCQAFGHRELLATLQNFGLVGTPQVSGSAR